ncbi:helix-turn-helix transcriptional regulator [Streptomyces mirabilis]|uniref:helix-turn-helix transcriptional regulator n=1 Tax=Streptomyces mirabilis TaxID=68239 RepID=UPI0033F91097
MDRLRQLRLAKDAMDRDWADPELDVEGVASYAGYSRYHFVRAFKAAYGQTPGQYLTHRRIERAGEMLRSADLSVTEICHLVVAVFAPPAMTAARLLHWSTWRRRHQATARRSHYQRRSADGPAG